MSLVSLGCPKNLVDSERMLGLLAEDGLAIAADPSQSDAIIINTCGFLEASRTESMEHIHQAIKLKEHGKVRRVIVAGCLVQRHKTDLLSEAPGIDRLVGVFDREHIVEAVRGKANPRQEHGHFLGKYHQVSVVSGQLSVAKGKPKLRAFEDDRSRLRLTPRHWAYLRMSEGCNQGCSFCTIPSIRGPMRSKPAEQILAEARELAADGAVELNLIGQDTTSYGTDIGLGGAGGAGGLAGLLRLLDKKLPEDVRWVRLMYAYPSCFSDEMIDAIAECDRVVKYIDMPLQHINDEILHRMKRRVTRKQTEELLGKLRKRVPGITIRTTFIAGSPGETEKQHKELVRFVREFGFDMMGVFPYSREKGTAMARLDGQVDAPAKAARVEELMLVQQEVAFAKAAGMKGKTIAVLIDGPAPTDAPANYVGRHAGQAPEIDSVTYIEATNLHAGQIVEAVVTGSSQYDLVAGLPKAKRKALKVLSAV